MFLFLNQNLGVVYLSVCVCMLSTCLSCIDASLLLSIGIEKRIVLTVSKVKYSVSYRTENTWYRPPLFFMCKCVVTLHFWRRHKQLEGGAQFGKKLRVYMGERLAPGGLLLAVSTWTLQASKQDESMGCPNCCDHLPVRPCVWTKWRCSWYVI